jgi:hypothetical protein
MVFNNFILSLQLDQNVFNPFIDKINDSYLNEDGEGDSYILADDYESPKTEFKTSPDYEVKLFSEIDNPDDNQSEGDGMLNPCYECIYCQQSSAPYDGSDSYICTRDGDPIRQDNTVENICHSFSKKEESCESE